MVPSFPYPVAAGVTREAYPSLAHLSPGLDLLRRGERYPGIDTNKQLFQGVLHDLSKYSKLTEEPLEFQHWNGGHGERFIRLPLSRSTKTGKVKPVLSKCINELLNACTGIYSNNDNNSDYNSEEEEKVFELLFDYLHTHHEEKLKEKLHEKQLTPKIMDEYNVVYSRQCLSII